MFHGVMAALEFLVLSVIVRIGVEQLQRRALQILQGSFLYPPVWCAAASGTGRFGGPGPFFRQAAPKRRAGMQFREEGSL